MTDKKSILGRLALIVTALIWGSSFVVLKLTLSSIGTMWVLAIRFSISALLLAAAAGRKLKRMSATAIKGSVIMGLTLATAYIVQTYGLLFTSPGKNAFLTATYCVLVPFMAWVVYKRKPGMSNILAAVICLIGVGFISLSGDSEGVNIGDVLTLFCGIFYSLQIILMEKYIGTGDSACIAAVEFAAAAALCWVGALIFESVPTAVPTETWYSIAYLSIMSTALCFFLQAWGMRYTSSSTAAMIMTLECVFGTLFSVIFYHEQMTLRLVVGFSLVFMAVVISETKLGFLRKKN